MSYLDRGCSANSLNMFSTILKIMLGMAVKEELIERNQCDSVQPAAVRTKPVEIMTVAEVKRLFEPMDPERMWESRRSSRIVGGLPSASGITSSTRRSGCGAWPTRR